MSDDPFVALLSDFLDQQLEGDERAGLEAHLLDCAGCRELLGDLRRVKEWAGVHDPGTPSIDLWPRVEDRIRRLQKRPRIETALPPAPGYRTGWKVAAALFLVLTITLAIRWLPRSSPPLMTLPESFEEGRTYLDAIAELEDVGRELTPGLDEATRADMERSLLLFDGVLEEQIGELKRLPESPLLRELVVRTAARKLVLLREANSTALAHRRLR